MEKIVTERTNLLLDYIEKFIHQTVDAANPTLKSTESRSAISGESLVGCEKMSIDLEGCVEPYINFLESEHHHYQFLGLRKALDTITNYFTIARGKCDYVVRQQRCQKLIVS